MANFIHSSKLNPCPICDRTKDGDCRQNHDQTLVFCHTCQTIDPNRPGWKFIKTSDKGAGWGMFGRHEKLDKKPANGQIERHHYIYKDRDGQPLVKVDKTRYSNGSKTYYQSHWSKGQWVKGGHPDPSTVPIYRYAEVRRAIDNGERIWWVEGEAAADYLWSIGMPATTALKSAVGANGESLNLNQDLKNGSIIVCPDKDLAGIAHADTVAAALGDLVVGWYYCFDNELWHHLNKGHGPDIEDEIVQKHLTLSDLIAGITNRKPLEDRNHQTTPAEPAKSTDRSPDALIAEVDRLIDQGIHNGRLRGEVACLAANYKVGIQAIWDLYRERLSDAEFAEDRQGLERSVADLLSADRQNLNLGEILPKGIAGAIAGEAALMGVRPETYFLSVLTATSAAQNAKTRVSICPALGWQEPPNLYAAIVAESSQRKTPILKATIYKPFRKLEDVADTQYRVASEMYEIDTDRYNAMKPADRFDSSVTKPKAPVRKLHLISDPSAEGLINQGIAHPEKTLLYLRDELAGVFADLNKYRSGKGSDRQLLLETFNGASIKSVRASKESQSHDELLLSIFGGIQPQVLQKIMGDGGDGDGLWGRFLYCIQPTVAAPSLPPYGTPRVADLPALLGTIYERIDNLAPGEYHLTHDAYDLFSQYRDKLEAMRVDKNNCPLMRHFVGKLQGITARIALNLHCFWAAATGDAVTSHIDRADMARAIDVAQFALAQIQILAAQVEQTTGESGQIYKLLQLLKSQAQPTVRDVQRHVTRGLADTARSLIDRAVQMGFVKWNDKKTISIATPQTTADIPVPQPPVVHRDVTTPKTPKTEVVTLQSAASTATTPTATATEPTAAATVLPAVKYDDWIEYQSNNYTIEWIEIAFHKHSVAKAWGEHLILWGGQAQKPTQISRNGKKWLLRVRNLPVKYLDYILNAEIGQLPKPLNPQRSTGASTGA